MADLSPALATWLTERVGRSVEVRSLELASAGARRLNALFHTVTESPDGDAPDVAHLALTMIPHAAIQILDVAGEAAVRNLAESAGVPVPHVHHVCLDESVLGGPFFISDAVAGETVPRRVLRLVHGADIGELVVQQLGTAMARLHSIPADHAPAALVRPTAPVEAALVGVDELMGQLLDPSPTFAFGIRWLERHLPSEPSTLSIVHSDIRTGNIIVAEDGLRAILDWETARIGDPMEDLAWPCQRMWRFREDRHTAAGMAGIPTLRDAYVAAGGAWDEDRFEWWRVLGTVRWGMGLAGQARQHLDGSFPSIVMAGSGRRVPELEYDTLLLLRDR
jgi:aminoglycoside phosphotransferase (APT) family kinase protein